METLEKNKVQEVVEKIEFSQVLAAQKLESEIKRQTEIKEKMCFLLDKLKALIPSLEQALNSVHLTIKEVGYGKTGDSNVWNEGDTLRISVTALPTEKFKFIAFAGYTARGSGKNQERLDAKAEKLANVIKEKTGVRYADVNCYSLEIKNETDSKSILINIGL